MKKLNILILLVLASFSLFAQNTSIGKVEYLEIKALL